MAYGPDHEIKHQCKCGFDKFRLITELVLTPSGSFTNNFWVECYKCDVVYDINGVQTEFGG